jgi:hypothetical protein
MWLHDFHHSLNRLRPGVFLRRNAIPEVLSQNDASRNGVPGPFPGNGITKNTHLRLNFGTPFCVPETFSNKK